jgi:SAM-dependent methyltransferase
VTEDPRPNQRPPGGTDQQRVYESIQRGDRTSPPTHDRCHWVLVLLRDTLQHVVASDLLAPGETLLDYGCGGTPYRAIFSHKFKHYFAADLPGNETASIVLSTDGRVPAEDESFDCVLSSQVLEHVADPALYLHEAYRVLKPGGSLVLSTHGIWHYHPDPTDFWRWTIEGLRLQIRRSGFDIAWAQSVLGPESTALQLWQDSTVDHLPTLFRSAYTWLLQRCIGAIERRRRVQYSPDSAVYVLLARKPCADWGLKGTS